MSGRHTNKTSVWHIVLMAMAVLMVLLYVAMGVAVIYQPDGYFNIPSGYSVPLGIILICYGVFRGYRIYQKLLKNEDNAS